MIVSIPCAGAVLRDPYALIILDGELKSQGVIPNLPPNRQNLTHESGGFGIVFQMMKAAPSSGWGGALPMIRGRNCRSMR